jgi:hypothetical protein
MNRKTAIWVLLPLVLFAFVYGLIHLFSLRMGKGDIYPEYSSLRTDPLGAKALYESLNRLRHLRIERNFRPVERSRTNTPATWYYLGADWDDFRSQGREVYQQLESLPRNGSRLVVAFYPVNENPTNRPLFKFRTPPPPVAGTNVLSKPTVMPETMWGFHFAHEALTIEDGVVEKAGAKLVTTDPLPPVITLHSSLYFTNLDSAWRVLYARSNLAVVIERPLGAGSLVLTADAYPFSNEALRKETNAALLAWFTGTHDRIVFDETHLGVSEEPGIGALMRQYRLHGLVVTLMILAGLFIWKNSTSLIPPHEEQETAGGVVTGRDSAAGILNLLRRNIAPKELLFVCVAEWRKSLGQNRKELLAKADELHAIAQTDAEKPFHARNPVERYREMCKMVKTAKR